MLLLCVPYITQEMLNWLGLYTHSSSRNFLTKQLYSTANKKGKLRAFTMQGSNKLKKAYTLTLSARQELLSQLPTEFVRDHLMTSDSSCSASNTHDALCCNVYYYLLSDAAFPYFRWYNVPYFANQ